MELQIKISGIILLALGLIHTVFPRYFKWKQELHSLSLINRQLMGIHTLFIALFVFLAGLLCLSSASELLNTNLGKKISLGFGIVWLIRLAVQFIGYSPRVWRGKAFETGVHVVFSLLWIYLSCIFLAVWFI